jgi:hypothetical protein
MVHSGAAEILFVHSRPASSNISSVMLDQLALMQQQQQQEPGDALQLAGSGAALSRCSSSSCSMVLQPCLTPTGPETGTVSRLSEAACAAAAAAAACEAGEAEGDGRSFLLQGFNEAADADWQDDSTAEENQEGSAAYARCLTGDVDSSCSAAPLRTAAYAARQTGEMHSSCNAAGADRSVELHLSPSWQQLAHIQRQRPDTSRVAVGVLASSRGSSAAGDAVATAALAADAWQCTAGGVDAFEHGNVQITGLSLSFSTVSSSSSSSSLSSVLDTAAVCMPAGELEQLHTFGRFQPPVGQLPADMAALDGTSPSATSPAAAVAAAAWQDSHSVDVPMFHQSTGARAAAEDDDEVCFSSPAPSLPPRLPTQSVTPKQSARTRSCTTTYLMTPPANSILAASPGGSVRPLGATAAAGGATAGGRSSWHAGMVLAASPFAAAGDNRPPAEMRYSVRHSLADTDGRPPLPAAAATAGMRAASRSCTDVMLLPARRSSSGVGTSVSTNCLFEPAPANPLELLPPVPLHDGGRNSSADAQCLPQQPSSSSSVFSDRTAATAVATTAAGNPRVTRTSSTSGGSDIAAAVAAAGGVIAGGVGSTSGEQQLQLCSLLGGALHSLAALQGVLQEGQEAADALLGR